MRHVRRTVTLLLTLALFPALVGCSPKAPIKPDEAPKASIAVTAGLST